jgi:hypothetical protein
MATRPKPAASSPATTRRPIGPAPSTQAGSSGAAPESLIARSATASGSASAPSRSLTVNPLASRPARHAGSHGGDYPGELVAEHVPGGHQVGRQAEHVQVRAADAAEADVDEDLAVGGDRTLDVRHGQRPVGADEGGLHRPTPARVLPRPEPCRSNVAMG